MHKDIRFATQIALLEQLYKKQLITEQEYKAMLKTIKRDYNIPQIWIDAQCIPGYNCLIS